LPRSSDLREGVLEVREGVARGLAAPGDRGGQGVGLVGRVEAPVLEVLVGLEDPGDSVFRVARADAMD